MTDQDLDALLQGLKAAGDVPEAPALPPEEDDQDADDVAPPQPREAPATLAPPANRRPWTAIVVAAAAVLVVGGVTLTRPDPTEPPRVTARGAPEAAAPVLRLELFTVRDGQTVTLGEGAALQTGEPVYARLAATPSTQVSLRVETPGGPEAVSTTEATPEPTALQGPRGHVGFAPDVPGQHVFVLSGGGGEARVVLNVQKKP